MIRDMQLFRLLIEGRVRITPLNFDDVQPVSYDVHLGPHALAFSNKVVTPIDLLDGPPEMEPVSIPMRDQPPEYLPPGGFLLGEVYENLILDADIGVTLHGKSTTGRIGLFVHVTAGLVDPGWGKLAPESGHLTVELFNASPRPIRLWEGMPIGQLEFQILDRPVERPYGDKYLRSHYAVSRGVRGSAGFGGT